MLLVCLSHSARLSYQLSSLLCSAVTMESVFTRVLAPCLSPNNSDPTQKESKSSLPEDLRFSDINSLVEDISLHSLTEMVGPHSSGISGVPTDLPSSSSCSHYASETILVEQESRPEPSDNIKIFFSHSPRVSDANGSLREDESQHEPGNFLTKEQTMSKKQLKKEKRYASIMANQDQIYNRAQMKYKLSVKADHVKSGLKKIKKSKKLLQTEKATSEEKLSKIHTEVNLLKKKIDCQDMKKSLLSKSLSNNNQNGIIKTTIKRFKCHKLTKKQANIEKRISSLLDEAEALKKTAAAEQEKLEQVKNGAQSKDRSDFFKLFIGESYRGESSSTAAEPKHNVEKLEQVGFKSSQT